MLVCQQLDELAMHPCQQTLRVRLKVYSNGQSIEEHSDDSLGAGTALKTPEEDCPKHNIALAGHRCDHQCPSSVKQSRGRNGCTSCDSAQTLPKGGGVLVAHFGQICALRSDVQY